MPHDMRAFIFDLDGTLLDSLEDIADSANAALASQGLATRAVADYRHFVGNGLEALMRRAAPQNTDDDVIASLLKAMHDNYTENWHNKTRPYNGIPQLLGKLSHLGFPLAVLSNKPHFLTTMVVQYFFPSVAFARVQGKPDNGKGKPDPSLALSIAEHMGVHPEYTAFIGDSSVDMDTAGAAGMLPIGVLWGFRSEEELLGHGARMTITHPAELFKAQK